jgi:glycosyltransferase involved in cell wall biosynthesis
MDDKANKTAIKILFLIDSLGMGGAERMLVTYLSHLDTVRFEPRVCVFNIREGNPIASDIQRLGIPVDLLPIHRIRDLKGLVRLVRYLHQYHINLVHTQLETVTVLGGIAARVVGIPAVHTLHTFDDPNLGIRGRLRARLVRFSLRHFHDIVIAVSDAVNRYEVLRGGLSAAHIVTLYNGIDIARFTPEAQTSRAIIRQALGVPAEVPLIVTVAVLRREKGIQYLIEAWPEIISSIPEAYCLIVGEGEYEDTLKMLTKNYGVANRVLFAGARSDIPELLGSSDLFVLPTLGDVLPTVLAEAMAMRLPIVASEVGGIPEMVEHTKNGLLIPPADPSRLAKACIQLLRNPHEAQSMGRVGQEIAEIRFNVLRQVRKLEEIYMKLIHKAYPNPVSSDQLLTRSSEGSRPT